MSEIVVTNDVQTHEAPELVCLMNENIIWIEVIEENSRLSKRYPYTRMSIESLKLIYDENQLKYDSESAQCFNIATGEYTTLQFNRCGMYMFHDTLSAGVGDFQEKESIVSKTHQSMPHVNIKNIHDTIYRFRLDPDIKPIWRAYMFTEFMFNDIRDLYSTDIESELFDKVKAWYLDKIRDRRSESFKELDQLEQETIDAGGDESDLEDIDTIKQMFRDIPQEVDLSKFKTVEELFEYWPSLLLPRTDANDVGLAPSLKFLISDREIADKEELKFLLENISIMDVEQLKSLLADLRADPGVDSNDWAIEMLHAKILDCNIDN